MSAQIVRYSSALGPQALPTTTESRPAAARPPLVHQEHRAGAVPRLGFTDDMQIVLALLPADLIHADDLELRVRRADAPTVAVGFIVLTNRGLRGFCA